MLIHLFVGVVPKEAAVVLNREHIRRKPPDQLQIDHASLGPTAQAAGSNESHT